MATFTPSRFLRLALGADAVASAALGLLCAAGATPLAGLLGLPEMLLRAAGLVLLPWAALVALAATRGALRSTYVWAIIAVNVVWAIDSFGLLFGAQINPTSLGTAFVIVQAIAVLALAECELIGLRQGRAVQTVPA